MSRWIKRIHIYVGLLNFSILLVYGIAGLDATFTGAPGGPRQEPVVEIVPYTVPPNLSDVEAANTIRVALGKTLSGPVNANGARRDRDNNLTFELYSTNGPTRITVLESQHQLHLETRRNGLWRYLNNLHATTQNARVPDLRIRLWGWYNEFAIWSLIAMSLSGVYLWLVSRPRFRWAQFSFATGSGIFLLLYIFTR